MAKTIDLGWDDGMVYIHQVLAEKANLEKAMNSQRLYNYYGARATTDDIIAFRKSRNATKVGPQIDLLQVKKVSDLKVKTPAGLNYYMQLALNGVAEKPEKSEVAAQATI